MGVETSEVKVIFQDKTLLLPQSKIFLIKALEAA